MDTAGPAPPIPRCIEDFEGPSLEPEVVLQVPGARVAIADYDLIRQDFPHLRNDAVERSHPELRGMAGAARDRAHRAILDRWLTSQGGVISRQQAGQCLANTPIAAGPEEATAFRPAGYGRALVLPALEGPGRPDASRTAGRPVGLLDVKGAGVRPGVTPGTGTHSNGLLMLGEALREFVFRGLIEEVFVHARAAYRTVPCYAVLALDFDVKRADGARAPAGLLLRRPHRRPIHRWGFKEFGSVEARVELEVELLLRRYGVTSAGPLTTIEITRRGGSVDLKYGEAVPAVLASLRERIADRAGIASGTGRLEGINIQFTREVAADPPVVLVVDFGSFRVKETFDHPIVSLVAGRLLRMGTIVRPDAADFVRPDPRIRLPFDLCGGEGGVFGYTGSDTGLSPFAGDNSRLLTHSLASGFREGRVTAEDLSRVLAAYSDAATSALRSTPA